MTYIRTSKRLHTDRNRLIVGIAIGVFVVLIVVHLIFPYIIPRVVLTVVRPFWRAQYAVEQGALMSPEAILTENQALKIRIQELEAQTGSLDAYRAELQSMLSIFGRGAVLSTTGSTTSTLLPTYDMQGNKLIVAAVIEKPPRGIYDQLILDIGSNDGVTSGSLVYAPGLILIGSTTEVYSDTARVALYSSVGSMYQVSIGPKHIPAVANGRGGGQYEAQIAQASDVHEGDVVSDAIIGTGPFGVVRAIVSNPSDPFETVLFAPPVSVYNLNWVFVGEKSERQATTTRIIKSKK